jgi:hypothetical protein
LTCGRVQTPQAISKSASQKTRVLAAFLILIVLICASPIAPLADAHLVIGMEATTMAVATALVARKAASEETEPLLGLFKLVLVLGAIPALWMIIQLLPLGYIGLANPIWETTRQALAHAIVGSIGVDTGAGLLGLIQYAVVLAILLVTMTVTRNQSRADRVLFALMTATTVICLSVAEPLSRLKLFTSPHEDAVRNVGVLGVLLAVTAVTRAFERWQLSRGFSKSKLMFSIAVGTASIAVCGSALAMRWTGNVEFSLAFALTILLAIVVVRLVEIDIWGLAAIAAIVLVVSASIVWIQYGRLVADPITAYAEDTTSVEVTRRILADTPWFGWGAGCFHILADIYRLPSEPTHVQAAATAAAKIAIELGPPVLWMILAAILLTTAVLLRGALKRGRASFYPALGAACLMALLLRGFADANIFAQAVSIITAATIGLALAQSSRRTGR